MERMRSPEWFLEKIAAGLEAAGAQPEPPAPVRKMSRAEIEALVSETLEEELERLDDLSDPAGPARRTGP
jgi:hypothetical protein